MITLGTVEPRTATVPFMDLGRAHGRLAGEFLEDFAALIDSGAFVNGPAVARFEKAFAAEIEVAHCVGMSSGLDALRLALIAAGLERGEEVIVPAMTFVPAGQKA